MKWLCKIIGHHWKVIWYSHGDTANTMKCIRCGDLGWRIK